MNDNTMFLGTGLTGPDFVRIVRDQPDQLWTESAIGGRVPALALRPFVTGQAFRARYLDEAPAYIVEHPGVRVTTSDEIAAHYAAGRTGDGLRSTSR
ncbi:hypothetical protein [Nocardia sp. NPDC003963]